MKSKVVVLGSQGMAGHVMYINLKQTGNYDVLGVARSDGRFVDKRMNVADFSALEAYLKQVKPDYVVNCIGVLVSQSASDIATAVLMNSYLPHFLSKLGDTCGFRLLHISTDCVFSGKTGGYTEASFRDGDDIYARSKALGEVINERDLTIRTSIIGPELKSDGTGLFDFFLKQNGMIQGYTQAMWSGITTMVLSRAVEQAIKHDVTGLIHLTNGEAISKYDLLRLFRQFTHHPVEIEAVAGKCVDKSLVDTRQTMPDMVCSYERMVREMVSFMRSHAALYEHYAL